MLDWDLNTNYICSDFSRKSVITSKSFFTLLLFISQVKELIATNEFKPNCALVLLDFFIRHGTIDPDTGTCLDNYSFFLSLLSNCFYVIIRNKSNESLLDQIFSFVKFGYKIYNKSYDNLFKFSYFSNKSMKKGI